MTSPAVSVIIPVYNAEKYLKECLDSVLGQSLESIEVICVDAGSQDGSLAILNAYAQKDMRIQVISGLGRLDAGAAWTATIFSIPACWRRPAKELRKTGRISWCSRRSNWICAQAP